MDTDITDRENYWNEKIVIERNCNNCPTAFTVEYGPPSVALTETARSEHYG